MKRNEKMLLKVLGDLQRGPRSATTKLMTESELDDNNIPVTLLSSNSGTTEGTRQPETINENIIGVFMDGEVQITKQYRPELVGNNNETLPTSVSIYSCEEDVGTPVAPLYSPITPIDRNTFLSGNNKLISDSSENSSPVRCMSPDTLKVFESLSKSDAFMLDDFNDDDSVKDPDYTADDSNNESSDECSPFTNTITALVHSETPVGSQYPRTTASKFRQPQIIHNNFSLGDDDNQVYIESEGDSQPQLQVLASKPLKRRVSENDLPHSRYPQKRSKRSNSASGALFSEAPKLNTNSPKKKYIADPSKWKRRIERDKRFKGKEYKTTKGKLIAARPLKQPKCLAKPNHKCNDKIPEQIRKKIYNSFRALSTLEEQRHFILQHVKREKKKRCTTNGPSRKQSTNHYSLTDSSNEKVEICREFFLDTLNITEGMVRGALRKVSTEGVLLIDKRGRKSPPNKLSSIRFNLIKSHILSFPSMESHYCRSNTEYKYLDSGLNVKIMYLLYKKKCEENGTIPACIEKYRKVFRSYKLRFHVPKKDMCKKCVSYKELKSNGQTSSKEDDDYSNHLKRRDDAYLRRDADKEAAKIDEKNLAFNFDLEAVLQTPKGAAGLFFYVRKLAVYNLTFYKFGNQDVDCYTWDETEGKRGSVEIATSVYKYITSKTGITHVRMMSDNCGGQQKNFNFSCMLLNLVTTHPTVETVDHVFYECGHSHMECDSIHSKIEQNAKNAPVYTPEGWMQIMRLARTNPRPFNVNVLVHNDFLDFNTNQLKFVEETARKSTQRKKKANKNNNQEENDFQQEEIKEREKVNFHDAVWIQYRKKSHNSIFIKTDYNEENFRELKLKPKRGKSVTLLPTSAYSERLPISKAKKRDLIKLCHDNQIPKYYHTYYENLPDSETVQDRLPEPDADEE